MEIWKKARFKKTIRELSQFDNKKPEELESEFDQSLMWIICIQLRLSKALRSWI